MKLQQKRLSLAFYSVARKTFTQMTKNGYLKVRELEPSQLLTLHRSNISGELDIQCRAMKIFLYTPKNMSGHMCKYYADASISFGGVCGITHRQTDRQTPLCY